MNYMLQLVESTVCVGSARLDSQPDIRLKQSFTIEFNECWKRERNPPKTVGKQSEALCIALYCSCCKLIETSEMN